MLYVILGTDAPDSYERRLGARPIHLDYVRWLQNAGRLIIAGPLPSIDSTDPGPAGVTGSLIIGEFPSREAAKKWAAADPYTLARVYEPITIRPLIGVRL